MDIATSKNLIPTMEQKAAKPTACQFSACCCLAPGNQNEDAFAENSSPWHAPVSENSQTNILPLCPAIPSGWELQRGHAGHREPVALKQLGLH